MGSQGNCQQQTHVGARRSIRDRRPLTASSGRSENALPQQVIAVIFDMDGLMLDTERVARIMWKRAALDLGCPISDELYASTLGRDARDTEVILVNALGPTFSY